MTDDASPENLRKFLESDDPALVRMGLSMAKGMGVPEELLPTILRLYMWDGDKSVRAAAKSVFTKYAPAEIQAKVKENWKASYRTLLVTGDKSIKVINKLIKEFKSQEQYDDVALHPLIKALGDENLDVRQAAAKALGEIGDACAVEPLIKALEDAERRVRSSATEALGKIGKPAVEPLIKVLEEGNKAAAWVLGKIGDKRAVEPLIKALEGGNSYATAPLWIIGDRRAVKPLTKALRDKNHAVRFSAAYALGKFGDARAVEPLIKALGDGEYDVRRNAVNALGEIGDKRAVKPIIKTLEDDNEFVRQDAVKALGKIGDKRAVEPLIKALGDECPCILCKKRRAERAEINAWAMDDFGRLSRRNIKSTNVRLGGVSHEIVTDALGKIGDKRAVEPLIKALGDKDNRVRLNAIKALGDIGDKRAVEPLIKVLEDGGETRDIWINVDRQDAAEALGKIGDKRAVEPLIKALKDKNEMVSYCAEIALEELGHEVK